MTPGRVLIGYAVNVAAGAIFSKSRGESRVQGQSGGFGDVRESGAGVKVMLARSAVQKWCAAALKVPHHSHRKRYCRPRACPVRTMHTAGAESPHTHGDVCPDGL